MKELVFDHHPLKHVSIPPQWAIAKIRDLTQDVQPGFPCGQHNREKEGVPHLRPMNISRSGTIDLSDVKYVAPKAGFEVTKGDVLFNNTNSPELIGKTAVCGIDVPLAYSNHMTRLRVNLALDAKFVAHQLHWLWMSGYFRHLCINHVNQASISSGPLAESVPIALPPLAEQRRIVAEIEKQFTRLDEAEVLLVTAERKLKRHTSATIRRIFAQNFPMRPLKELASIKGGLTMHADRPDLSRCTAVPYLRVANVQRGFLDLTVVKTIMATREELEELALEPGDVLFNEGGDRDKLGRGWVWQGEISPCIHQNHVFRARVNSSALPKWISYYANELGRQYFIKEGKQTTNLASINITKLGSLPIPTPPIDVQKQMLETIEAMTSVSKCLSNELARARSRAFRLRAAILAKAFSGQLIPQDPNDEPASVLLERIRRERSGYATTPKPSRKRKRPQLVTQQ